MYVVTSSQAKLDKKVAGDKIAADLHFQKSAEGLVDAVKRIELLEEFMYVCCTIQRKRSVTLLLT